MLDKFIELMYNINRSGELKKKKKNKKSFTFFFLFGTQNYK